MKEQLITFETAKLAKEKEFNGTVSCGYTDEGLEYRPAYWDIDCEVNEIILKRDSLDEDIVCLAPTQSLLQRWLREVHEIHLEINIYDNSRTYHFEYIVITSKDRDYNDLDMMDSAKRHYNNEKYNTYEEALEKGLTEALKLILLK